MKILIAVPTFETITAETFKSIYNIRRNHGIETDFEFVKGYDCAKARNEIVKNALSGNYNYVLMIDSDVIVPEDVLEKMLEYPVEVCFGLYPHKNTKEGYAEIFKPIDGDYKERFTYNELKDQIRVDIKGGGFGCVLIKCEVFAYMPYPWFQFVSYSNETFLSEDLYFCSNAKRAGFRLQADTRVKCGHMARYFQYE